MARTKTQLSPFANPRLRPPANLSAGAAAVFKLIIDEVDRDHFSKVDVVLLVEYCRAVDLANRADAELTRGGAVVDDKASPWIVVQEKCVRAIVALSARLRLSPQSRFDRLKAGTTARPQFKPWEMDPDGLLAAPYGEDKRPKKGLASFR